MELGLELHIFKCVTGGEALFCCVSKSDFEKYGDECFSNPKVTKGVSDDQDEAFHDYQFNFILAADVGLESDERHAH